MASCNHGRNILILISTSVLFLTANATIYHDSVRTTPQALPLRRGRRSSPYELNPNYAPCHAIHNSPVTVGDLERRQITQAPLQQETRLETKSAKQATFGHHRQSPSLWESVQTYFAQLHRISPTLSVGTIACLLVFCLWHVPPFQTLLQHYFVCSRINVLKRHRYPALLLSAVSHASPAHLLMNLYAFLTFGPSVRQTLLSTRTTTNGCDWSLWPFVVGAAMAGSCVYLLFAGRGDGCMGLSAVCLGLLAFYARAYPQKELGFVVGIFPIRLPGQVVLACLFLWSLLGSLAGNAGGVAHTAHLGGLVFGSAYYELWLRRRDI